MIAPALRTDVAFGVDGNYAPHLAATIASIVKLAPADAFRFIILSVDIDAEARRLVEKCAKGAEFVWIDVEEDDLPAFGSRGHFTRAILFRLGLEKLAPADCHRVIYLDVDLIVTTDLRELSRWDIGGHSIAAAIDVNEDADAFAEKWGLPAGHDYINVGVLLIDLDRVRAEKGFTRAIELYSREGDRFPWPDQDAINHVYWGAVSRLPGKWNVQATTAINMARHEMPGYAEAPCIVHYTGSQKPWISRSYHPWAWLYWDAVRRTPFFDMVARRHGVTLRERLKILVRWRFRKFDPDGPVACRGGQRRVRIARNVTSDPLDISLVVGTCNRSEQIVACLDAIRNIRYKGSWELIVVDNGSTDDTREIVERELAAMPVPAKLLIETKRGVSAARNTGVAHARGRILAFTDDDCYVDPNFLTEVRTAFKDKTLGYVTGRVELFDETDAAVTVNFSQVSRRYPAGQYLHTDGLIGANLAFRREAFADICGFDESMGAGRLFAGEDMDAAARAGSAGWDGAYHPGMVISHHHGRKEKDVAALYKFYDIGRGAYNMKYLLRGEVIPFLKGISSLRWRMGPVTSWRLKTFSTPWWEFYGATSYLVLWLRNFLLGANG
ncbi:glycosyltransferase [Hyphomonas sp. WL0036]|uniref:glycosyltransferase n=1 Tax=Hyphomonas sediminis TaxID=2866160 RepID=UPI001C824211|nr:glycosyltransferase [Hyphomonas sediminis]MBY9067942.1 glycosyltransferase [Hyphomonas sediminis]